MNKISFSYEGMGIETRFKKEAKLDNSEIAEIFHLPSIYSVPHISEALLSRVLKHSLSFAKKNYNKIPIFFCILLAVI